MICPKCKKPYPDKTLFSIPFTEKEVYLYCEDCHTVTSLSKALKVENEKLKSDLEIQKNLTRQACFEANRAYQETEKWKKMFYDLVDMQASASTDPKVIVVESRSADSEVK